MEKEIKEIDSTAYREVETIKGAADAQAARIYAELAKWHAEGRIKYRVDVRPGLENAPKALRALFDGSNEGKLVIEVAAPSAVA